MVLRAPDRAADAPDFGERVFEEQLATLHRAMRDTFSAEAASQALAEAGRRAAMELLRPITPAERARRRDLPRPVAIKQLLNSLHQWAPRFAAGRRFSATGGEQPVLIIAANPLCDAPARGTRVCAWHEALFETLFQALVTPESRVVETACLALGDELCRFEVTFDSL